MSELNAVNRVLDLIHLPTISSFEDDEDDVVTEIRNEMKVIKEDMLKGFASYSNMAQLQVNPDNLTKKYYVGPSVLAILTKGFYLTGDGEVLENTLPAVGADNAFFAGANLSFPNFRFNQLNGTHPVTLLVHLDVPYEKLTKAFLSYLAYQVAENLVMRNSDAPKDAYFAKNLDRARTMYQKEEFNARDVNTLNLKLWRRGY